MAAKQTYNKFVKNRNKEIKTYVYTYLYLRNEYVENKKKHLNSFVRSSNPIERFITLTNPSII
jgi:hypothetical protein